MLLFRTITRRPELAWAGGFGGGEHALEGVAAAELVEGAAVIGVVVALFTDSNALLDDFGVQAGDAGRGVGSESLAWASSFFPGVEVFDVRAAEFPEGRGFDDVVAGAIAGVRALTGRGSGWRGVVVHDARDGL